MVFPPHTNNTTYIESKNSFVGGQKHCEIWNLKWGWLCPTDEKVCFSGIKTYVFLRKKLPFFHFILTYSRRFFSKEKWNIRIRMFSTRPILSPNSFGALHPQFDVTPMSVTSHSHRRAQLQLYSTSAFLPFEKTIKVGYKLTLTNSYYLVCKKAIYNLCTTSWYVCKKHTIL